jgi:GGDEF domain-containing protein
MARRRGKRMSKDEIIHRLSTDSVFGCYTRQALEVSLINDLINKKKGIIFFDINDLAKLNTKLGYREVNRRIHNSLRLRQEDIIIVRWYSGDEIIVIVDEQTETDQVVKRLETMLAENGLSAEFAWDNVKILNFQQLTNVVGKLAKIVSAKKKRNKRGRH